MYRKTNAKMAEANADLARDIEQHSIVYWIDRDGVLEPARDMMEWARRLGDWSLKCVAEHVFDAPVRGSVRLVTVFHGIDNSFGAFDPPRLYGTMLFAVPDRVELGEWMTATRAEAAAMHERIRLGLERGDPVIRARGLIDLEEENT